MSADAADRKSYRIDAELFAIARTRLCDIVMKGGVTSGVVYPLAICRLAQTYIIKRIGGTSVGAIAASLTAAAEYRRREDPISPGAGYEILSQLPNFLTESGTLRALFTADRAGAPLLNVALKCTGSANVWQKGLAVAGALVAAYFWLPMLVTAAFFGLTFWIGQPAGVAAEWRCTLGAIALSLLATPLGLIGWYAFRFIRVVNENDFGWCHGFRADRAAGFEAARAGRNSLSLPAAQTPPLTDWLDALIAETAGSDRSQPLTFGDLWGRAWKAGSRSIDLRTVTTCVTLGRPFELPISADEIVGADDPQTDVDDEGQRRPRLYFLESEFVAFFPRHIVDHLIRAGAPKTCGRLIFHRFPAAHAVPIVVAARLSMSFPILFCAVPLHALDANGDMRRVWFSDGGLSSNFPIYLFDRPLPRWPTFAIDLLGGDPDTARHDPADRHTGTCYEPGQVFMEDKIPLGTVNPWNLQGGGATADVFAFLLAIVDTMRTWQDTKLGMLRGNASRTVGIRLDQNEGGLNLTMPPETIAKLVELGDRAGATLVNDFAAGGDAPAWKAQRWFRFRATFAAAARWLELLPIGYAPLGNPPSQESYAGLIAANFPAPRSADALHAVKSLVDERASWTNAQFRDPRFEDGEPEPTADLRLRATL